MPSAAFGPPNDRAILFREIVAETMFLLRVLFFVVWKADTQESLDCVVESFFELEKFIQKEVIHLVNGFLVSLNPLIKVDLNRCENLL